MIRHLKRVYYILRDALTGRFISKAEFDKRDKATTTKEAR